MPVLIRVLEEQPAIGDTFVTADTLRLVTGIDVGYDVFVSTYTSNDEVKRQRMIAKWNAWSREHLSLPECVETTNYSKTMWP